MPVAESDAEFLPKDVWAVDKNLDPHFEGNSDTCTDFLRQNSVRFLKEIPMEICYFVRKSAGISHVSRTIQKIKFRHFRWMPEIFVEFLQTTLIFVGQYVVILRYANWLWYHGNWQCDWLIKVMTWTMLISTSSAEQMEPSMTDFISYSL